MANDPTNPVGAKLSKVLMHLLAVIASVMCVLFLAVMLTDLGSTLFFMAALIGAPLFIGYSIWELAKAFR